MNFQKKRKYQIIVHLHPGIKEDIKQDFKKYFEKSFDFKTGDISSSLKKSFLTLKLFLNGNFEDSLYNKVPVILLDLHKKNYIHFKT